MITRDQSTDTNTSTATAPATPGMQHSSPSSTPSEFHLPMFQGVGPIKISPNACGAGQQCDGRMGYEYVYERRTKTKQSAEATNRGASIHEILLGRTQHSQFTSMSVGNAFRAEDRLSDWQPSVLALGEIDYHESARAIAEYLRANWPGVVWQCEQELHVPLTPGISLVGRIDLWTPNSLTSHGNGGADGSHCVDIIDIKTSTGYTKAHTKSTQSPYMNLQLNLYAKMVMHQTGRVPRIWQLCHNPSRKWSKMKGKGKDRRPAPGATLLPFVTFHKQFVTSETAIEHAAQYAVATAQRRELLFRQSPADWQRSFACDHPYQCPHTSDCKRDLGAHFNDGAQLQQGVRVQYNNPRAMGTASPERVNDLRTILNAPTQNFTGAK